MTILKESLSDFKEKYEHALKLVEDCKPDSLEPYKNHYKSRDILVELEKKLENLIESTSDEQDVLTFKAIYGSVLKEIGKLNIFVEETGESEKYLKRALDVCEPLKFESSIVICYLDVLNQLGILYSKLMDGEKSKEFLLKCEKDAEEFKTTENLPLTVFDVFGTSDEIEKGKGKEALEKTITLTYFYLAQIYGTEGDLETSGKYCHFTLKRQLDFNDYEPVDWALNAATLSQYYFGKNMLRQSRHLLAASVYMLDRYSDELEKKELTPEQREAAVENLKHRTADVHYCFAKYCIYIITTSIERLMQDDEESNKETDKASFKVSNECDRFNLKLDVYENVITDDFVLTFEDAKEVFLTAQSYLNDAKSYYSLENEASQHARIVQDHATLYKRLAFFEEDAPTQAKLHKRRADQLENLLEKLNPTYYLNICRELLFELGLTYSDILDIKCDILKFSDVQPNMLSKINLLCHKAIKKFLEFENTYRNKDTKEIPANTEVDELQLIACANFNLGRLHYKFITPDKKMQLENVTKSYEHYKIFIDYCEKNPPIAASMKGELGVTKNMCDLLPIKIRKLTDEINS
jgi:KIF-binding protein